MKRETLSEFAQRVSLQAITRRFFLRECMTGLGASWLASRAVAAPGPAIGAHHAPRAKQVIFLHMLGAPSQLELFDPKPQLLAHHGQDCPEEFIAGKRFAFIKGRPQLLGSQYPFAQHGQSGTWLSDRLPFLSHHVDDLCFIHTMQTDQFNHGPAKLMVYTGQARTGYPSIGSWVTWGLGCENEEIPGFLVLLSGGRPPRVGKALWSSGFLPSVYQGVQCRTSGAPVLNIADPPNVSREDRRAMLDTLDALNRHSHETFHDPETLTRIAQYEMAYKMQAAVPEVMDITREPAETLEMYGAVPGSQSLANNCLLARRLAEAGVRYIQLFDWGWDSHGTSSAEALNDGFQNKCREMDRPVAALLADLKRRGMLEDTLVIFSGEFGRTPMREQRSGKLIGRDHHPEAFTLWMAGAGVRKGHHHGLTDELGYAPVENAVPLRDFHATLLHLLGLDHTRLSMPFQGLDQKLTTVHPARVIDGILA